jgi:hypothetical protein
VSINSSESEAIEDNQSVSLVIDHSIITTSLFVRSIFFDDPFLKCLISDEREAQSEECHLMID